MKTFLALLPVCVAGLGITMQLPPLGQDGPITGQIIDLEPGMVYSNYKVAVLTSGDGGGTWWDKSHGPYFKAWQRDPVGYPNPGQEQDAAVVIQPDWSWTLADYEQPDDKNSRLWRAYLMPASFDMTWPNYEIEGIPMRGDVPNNALTWVEVDRANGAATDGGVNPNPPANGGEDDGNGEDDGEDDNGTPTTPPSGGVPQRSPTSSPAAPIAASSAISTAVTGLLVGAAGVVALAMGL